MSQYEVDAIVEAVEYANEQYDEAPFANLTFTQVQRRYAQLIVEWLHEHNWRIAGAD